MFFKQTLQKRLISRLTKERKVKFISFSDARRVGFIFQNNIDGNFEEIEKFIAFLLEKHITFYGIAIFNIKQKNKTSFKNERVIQLESVDLKYSGVPKSHKIANFIKNEFDILIDFTPEYNFTSHYLSVISKAQFKIGRYSFENTPYDFVLEQSENKNIDDFMKRLLFYFNSIRPD